jgi:hypothetical protein
MARVTVRLSGGPGNQMFQYAAGYALAARTGGVLHLDSTALMRPERPYSLDALQISDPVEKWSLATYWRRRLWRRIGLPERHVYRERHFHYDPCFEALAPPVTMDGR